MAEFAALPFAVQRQIVMKVHALVGYLDRDPKEAANLGSPYTDPCEPNITPKQVDDLPQEERLPQRKEAFDILGAHLNKPLSAPSAWLPTVAASDEAKSAEHTGAK